MRVDRFLKSPPNFPPITVNDQPLLANSISSPRFCLHLVQSRWQQGSWNSRWVKLKQNFQVPCCTAVVKRYSCILPDTITLYWRWMICLHHPRNFYLARGQIFDKIFLSKSCQVNIIKTSRPEGTEGNAKILVQIMKWCHLWKKKVFRHYDRSLLTVLSLDYYLRSILLETKLNIL